MGAVLPRFGKIAHAACTYAELGARLSTFPGELAAELPDGEFVDLAFGYHLDCELVDLAIRDSGEPAPLLQGCCLSMVTSYQATRRDTG